jgi:transcription elongation factor Elf1
MKDPLLKCPECGSDKVTVCHKQRFMANTGEHYCHSVKTQDANSEATCLYCGWMGLRDEMEKTA